MAIHRPPKRLFAVSHKGQVRASVISTLYYWLDGAESLRKTTPCLYADDYEILSSSNDYTELIDNLNSADPNQVYDYWIDI
jgi:hypothetical protein